MQSQVLLQFCIDTAGGGGYPFYQVLNFEKNTNSQNQEANVFYHHYTEYHCTDI